MIPHCRILYTVLYLCCTLSTLTCTVVHRVVGLPNWEGVGAGTVFGTTRPPGGNHRQGTTPYHTRGKNSVLGAGKTVAKKKKKPTLHKATRLPTAQRAVRVDWLREVLARIRQDSTERGKKLPRAGKTFAPVPSLLPSRPFSFDAGASGVLPAIFPRPIPTCGGKKKRKETTGRARPEVGDASIQSGQISESKGLVSIDRSEDAALLITTPRLRPRSSTNDLAPLRRMGWISLRLAGASLGARR